jgi:hypothetical protein
VPADGRPVAANKLLVTGAGVHSSKSRSLQICKGASTNYSYIHTSSVTPRTHPCMCCATFATKNATGLTAGVFVIRPQKIRPRLRHVCWEVPPKSLLGASTGRGPHCDTGRTGTRQPNRQSIISFFGRQAYGDGHAYDGPVGVEP